MSGSIISGAEDLIGGAAKGFLSGGPIGALLGAITGILPDIGVHLFGPSGEAVTAAVEAAAAAATGVPKPTAADVSGLAPDAMAQFRVQLAQIAATAQKDKDAAATAQMTLQLAGMQSALADTAGARTMAAATSGPTRWGSTIVSVIVLLAFAALVVGPVVTGRALPVDAGLLQVLYAGVMLVLGFWLGSSASSAHKDERLADSVPSSVVRSFAGGASSVPLAR